MTDPRTRSRNETSDRGHGPGRLVVVVVAVMTLLLAGSALGQEVEEPTESSDGPSCTEEGLLLPAPEGGSPRVVTLPGPCFSVSTEGSRSAVAAGESGAFVVDHPPSGEAVVRAVKSAGRVETARLQGEYLVLTEEVNTVRWIDLAQVQVADPVDEGSADGGAEGQAEALTEASAVGQVITIRGPRVFVEGEGVAGGPGPGALIRVHNDGRARTIDPATGRVLDRGAAAYESVLRVVANDGEQLVAELGRGDRAQVGDSVGHRAGLVPTEELMIPRSTRNLVAASLQVTPAISLSGPGALGFGRLTVAYVLPIPMRVEVALRQGFVALPTDDTPMHSGFALEGLVTLDLDPFEVGLAVGYQRFRGPTTGLVLGHYLRAGFRDGLSFEVHTRFLLGTDNPFGGVEGRGQIPLGRSAWLTLEGGGGSSIGFGLVGTRIQLRAQGGKGSWSINPAVGFAGTWYSTTVSFEEYCEARPSDWECDPGEYESVDQGDRYLSNTMIGPAISVTLEARL